MKNKTIIFAFVFGIVACNENTSVSGAGNTASIEWTGATVSSDISEEDYVNLCLDSGGSLSIRPCCGDGYPYVDECRGEATCSRQSDEKCVEVKDCICPSWHCFSAESGCVWAE